MNAWIGLSACCLIFGAVGASLPARPINRRINAAIFAAASLIALPGTDSLAMWLHALIGTPSATLAQMALLLCLGLPPKRPAKPILVAFVLIALEFYVLALGVGQLDVYGIGYRSPLLIAAIFPLGLWLSHHRQTGWLFILAIDLLAYGLGLYPNLWDALFDPVLTACVIFSLLPLRPKKSPIPTPQN